MVGKSEITQITIGTLRPDGHRQDFAGGGKCKFEAPIDSYKLEGDEQE